MGEQVIDEGAKLPHGDPGGEPGPRTVLLVEDEILVRYALAFSLRAQGLKVLEASNAAEALALLEGGHTVNLLFSDIQMPGDLDGVALAAAVRERSPTTVVMLTSGKPPPPDAAPLGQFVPKPYAPEAVLASILGSLDRPAEAATAISPTTIPPTTIPSTTIPSTGPGTGSETGEGGGDAA